MTACWLEKFCEKPGCDERDATEWIEKRIAIVRAAIADFYLRKRESNPVFPVCARMLCHSNFASGPA
jgi:hypothetical protein